MKRNLLLLMILFVISNQLLKAKGFVMCSDTSTSVSYDFYSSDLSIVGGGFSIKSLFEEPEAFDKGTFVFCFAAGFKNNISVMSEDHNVKVLPLMVMLEFPIYSNVGLGLSAGAMQWEPKQGNGISYSYYTISPRVAYHLNLGERFDLYAGVHLNTRMAIAQQEDTQSSQFRRIKVDAGAHAGLRFYLKNAFGVFLEYGADGPACFKGGIVIRFGHS